MQPLIAAEDIFQYAAVKFVAGAGDVDEIELVDGSVVTDFTWGIAQTAALAGEAVDVQTQPGLQSRAVAGAAITAGAPLKVDTAVPGRLIAVVADTDIVVAWAMEDAVDDQIFKVITKFETKSKS
jgi:hypothetical protein